MDVEAGRLGPPVSTDLLRTISPTIRDVNAPLPPVQFGSTEQLELTTAHRRGGMPVGTITPWRIQVDSELVTEISQHSRREIASASETHPPATNGCSGH